MKKVLVFNFYKGIIARGIVVQMDNFCHALNKNNVPYDVISCPAIFRRFPILGIVFLLYEQFIVPIKALRYDVVVYPFNSISIFAPLHRGSLLIVHDFIQNRKKFPGYHKAISYVVRITQCWYSLWRGDVAFITETVKRQADILAMFRFSRKFILPNTFFLFSKLVTESKCHSQNDHMNGKYVLLCTGKVPTKDLARALSLYSLIPYENRLPIRVLGLAGDVDFFKSKLRSDIEYCVLPVISDEEVIFNYNNADFIWVHSNQEGFGRNVTEGLLCHKKILASDIKPFREQSNNNVYLYNNSDRETFLHAYKKCASAIFYEDERALNTDNVFNLNMKRLLNCSDFV